jgi:hypothetical protein
MSGGRIPLAQPMTLDFRQVTLVNLSILRDLLVIPVLPRGMVALWSGRVAEVPAGWALCDGRNGTPDLRDRFVVGAGVDAAGRASCTLEASATQQGGSLTHKHHFTTDGHLHWTKSNGSLFDPAVAPTQDITGEKDSGTTDGPDSVPVPYYALAYIMKL